MSEKKVWLVTGAGRGMGVDIARAALAAGHAVVATARNTGTVTAALGKDGGLLASSSTSPTPPTPRPP
jgi:NAD(P)-dependent dehydrogenase (short-subunit alcohol dehydrogenase family)